MANRIVGYHFEMQFGPMWRAVAPLVIARAREVGVTVSQLGEELHPRAMMLRVAGTHWADLRTGEVHFQVVEQRSDLDGGVLQELCVTSKKMLSPFGLLEEMKGWTSSKLEKAVGLWIRDGSLVLHAWQDDRRSLPEQVLVEFDMWKALDAMARYASGEPSFGPTPYQAPSWASAFAMTARTEGAMAHAGFNNEKFLVAGAVTLMQRDVSD